MSAAEPYDNAEALRIMEDLYALQEELALDPLRPEERAAGSRATGEKTPVAILHEDRTRYSDALAVLRLSDFAQLVGRG